MTQSQTINGLAKMFPDINIFTYSADELYRTSEQLRDKGVVICSSCGHMTSDQRDRCKKCGDEIIVITKRVYIKQGQLRQNGYFIEGSSIPLPYHSRWKDYLVQAVCEVNIRQKLLLNGRGKGVMVDPGRWYYVNRKWRSQEEITGLMQLKNMETA